MAGLLVTLYLIHIFPFISKQNYKDGLKSRLIYQLQIKVLFSIDPILDAATQSRPNVLHRCLLGHFYYKAHIQGVGHSGKIKDYTLRISSDLSEKSHYIVRYEGRSINAQILLCISQSITAFEVRHKKITLELVYCLPKGTSISLFLVLHKKHSNHGHDQAPYCPP